MAAELNGRGGVSVPVKPEIIKRTVDEQGNWIDAQGQAVPKKYIDQAVRERDHLVRQIFRKGIKLRRQVDQTKADVVALLDGHLETLARRHEARWKGNAELVTFDGRLKVEIKVNEALEFDERLQLAKQKIDNCLRQWTGGARSEIRAIIGRAFQVDHKGTINVRSILTLRQFRFKDKQWQEAMGLISDSLRIRSTRRYVNLYRRDATTGRFVLVTLNWSALTGEELDR